MKTITELKELFENLGKDGHVLSADNNIARLDRVAPRSKMGFKMVFNYRFKTEQKMLEYVNEYYDNKIKSIQDEKDRKATLKLKDAEDKKNVKVGDIFSYSWGWEQTNVNLYQVVQKPTANSIIIREIAHETVKETSWGSENCKAVIDCFIGDEEKVRLGGDYFKRSCGSARKVENPDEATFHRSWYA